MRSDNTSRGMEEAPKAMTEVIRNDKNAYVAAEQRLASAEASSPRHHAAISSFDSSTDATGNGGDEHPSTPASSLPSPTHSRPATGAGRSDSLANPSGSQWSGSQSLVLSAVVHSGTTTLAGPTSASKQSGLGSSGQLPGLGRGIADNGFLPAFTGGSNRSTEEVLAAALARLQLQQQLQQQQQQSLDAQQHPRPPLTHMLLQNWDFGFGADRQPPQNHPLLPSTFPFPSTAAAAYGSYLNDPRFSGLSADPAGGTAVGASRGASRRGPLPTPLQLAGRQLVASQDGRLRTPLTAGGGGGGLGGTAPGGGPSVGAKFGAPPAKARHASQVPHASLDLSRDFMATSHSSARALVPSLALALLPSYQHQHQHQHQHLLPTPSSLRSLPPPGLLTSPRTGLHPSLAAMAPPGALPLSSAVPGTTVTVPSAVGGSSLAGGTVTGGGGSVSVSSDAAVLLIPSPSPPRHAVYNSSTVAFVPLPSNQRPSTRQRALAPATAAAASAPAASGGLLAAAAASALASSLSAPASFTVPTSIHLAATGGGAFVAAPNTPGPFTSKPVPQLYSPPRRNPGGAVYSLSPEPSGYSTASAGGMIEALPPTLKVLDRATPPRPALTQAVLHTHQIRYNEGASSVSAAVSAAAAAGDCSGGGSVQAGGAEGADGNRVQLLPPQFQYQPLRRQQPQQQLHQRSLEGQRSLPDFRQISQPGAAEDPQQQQQQQQEQQQPTSGRVPRMPQLPSMPRFTPLPQADPHAQVYPHLLPHPTSHAHPHPHPHPHPHSQLQFHRISSLGPWTPHPRTPSPGLPGSPPMHPRGHGGGRGGGQEVQPPDLALSPSTRPSSPIRRSPPHPPRHATRSLSPSRPAQETQLTDVTAAAATAATVAPAAVAPSVPGELPDRSQTLSQADVGASVPPPPLSTTDPEVPGQHAVAEAPPSPPQPTAEPPPPPQAQPSAPGTPTPPPPPPPLVLAAPVGRRALADDNAAAPPLLLPTAFSGDSDMFDSAPPSVSLTPGPSTSLSSGLSTVPPQAQPSPPELTAAAAAAPVSPLRPITAAPDSPLTAATATVRDGGALEMVSEARADAVWCLDGRAAAEAAGARGANVEADAGTTADAACDKDQPMGAVVGDEPSTGLLAATAATLAGGVAGSWAGSEGGGACIAGGEQPVAASTCETTSEHATARTVVEAAAAAAEAEIQTAEQPPVPPPPASTRAGAPGPPVVAMATISHPPPGATTTTTTTILRKLVPYSAADSPIFHPPSPPARPPPFRAATGVVGDPPLSLAAGGGRRLYASFSHAARAVDGPSANLRHSAGNAPSNPQVRREAGLGPPAAAAAALTATAAASGPVTRDQVQQSQPPAPPPGLFSLRRTAYNDWVEGAQTLDRLAAVTTSPAAAAEGANGGGGGAVVVGGVVASGLEGKALVLKRQLQERTAPVFYKPAFHKPLLGGDVLHVL